MSLEKDNIHDKPVLSVVTKLADMPIELSKESPTIDSGYSSPASSVVGSNRKHRVSPIYRMSPTQEIDDSKESLAARISDVVSDFVWGNDWNDNAKGAITAANDLLDKLESAKSPAQVAVALLLVSDTALKSFLLKKFNKDNVKSCQETAYVEMVAKITEVALPSLPIKVKKEDDISLIVGKCSSLTIPAQRTGLRAVITELWKLTKSGKLNSELFQESLVALVVNAADPKAVKQIKENAMKGMSPDNSADKAPMPLPYARCSDDMGLAQQNSYAPPLLPRSTYALVY